MYARNHVNGGRSVIVSVLWDAMGFGLEDAVLIPRDDVTIDDGHGPRQPRIPLADVLDLPGWTISQQPRMVRANVRRGWHRFQFELSEEQKSAPADDTAEAHGPALAEPTRIQDDTTTPPPAQAADDYIHVDTLVEYPAVLVLARIDRRSHSVFACIDGRVLHNDIELDQRIRMFSDIHHAGGNEYTYTLASLANADDVLAARRRDLEIELGI